MKKLVLIIACSCLYIHFVFAQGGTWTWISGSDQAFNAGAFGTQGVPSVNNYPPGLYECCEWKDNQGIFWIYGGTNPNMGDMWRFNPVTLEWTWMTGTGQPNAQPVYGLQGIPDPANTPGSRSYC